LNFSRVHIHNLNKSGLWIALIFLLCSFAKAQSEFPINDPRNPKCPCHKYQQQAEEEYKQLLAQNNSVNSSNEITMNDDKLIHGGASNHAFGNLPGNTINPPKHGGISSDDLLRINVWEGKDVFGNINYDPGELIVSEQKADRSGSTYKEYHSSNTARWKGKHKKHTAFHKQLKRIFYVGGWDIWKRKRNAASCYHWK
jgi:hypothetical protein